MEERRIERVGVSMKTYAEVDREVLPIVGKCLDGMTKAAESIEPKTVSTHAHTCKIVCTVFFQVRTMWVLCVVDGIPASPESRLLALQNSEILRYLPHPSTSNAHLLNHNKTWD